MITFVNYNSRLPLSRDQVALLAAQASDLEDLCLLVATPDSIWVDASLDVFFVSSDEIDEIRINSELPRIPADDESELPATDLLGVYINRNSKFGRPIIMVSPEKVLSAAKNSGCIGYLDLLSKVVIHEIAHHLMSPPDFDLEEFIESYSSLYPHLREGFPAIETANSRLLAYEAQVMERDVQSTLLESETMNGINSRKYLQHLTATSQSIHIIEESLANLVPLALPSLQGSKTSFRNFVSKQPPAYRAALSYESTSTYREVLVTCRNWRYFKERFEIEFSEISSLLLGIQVHLRRNIMDLLLDDTAHKLLCGGSVSLNEINEINKNNGREFLLNILRKIEQEIPYLIGNASDHRKLLYGQDGLYETYIKIWEKRVGFGFFHRDDGKLARRCERSFSKWRTFHKT